MRLRVLLHVHACIAVKEFHLISWNFLMLQDAACPFSQTSPRLNNPHQQDAVMASKELLCILTEGSDQWRKEAKENSNKVEMILGMPIDAVFLKRSNWLTFSFSLSLGLCFHFFGLPGVTVLLLQALLTLFQGLKFELRLLQDRLLGGFLNTQQRTQLQ